MTVQLSHVHVYVDDPEAALVFYRDALGLTVANDVENDGFHWITLASAEQPELSIVLSHPKVGRSEEDGDALAAMLAKGELPGPFFASADLDALFAKVQEIGGIEIVQEPADQFWGARDAAFRDPAGNLVRVSQA